MKEKKTLILSLVAVLTLVAVVIGATYAYFTAQRGTGTNANLNVQAGTTDSLSFAAGKSLNIYATSETFGSGKGNISDSTTATASLVANNGTNQASYNYYVYLNIEANDLVYTTEGKTPELLLTVTDPAGNQLTSIAGLNYVTQNGVSGFDVTTQTGLIKIADNYAIETTSNISQEWSITLTLINLETDQEQNTSKTFSAKIKIQQDEIPTIGSKCAGENMASCIKENYQLDSSILLHNSSLTNGANDGSYRYAGASATTNNYVCFGSDAATCPTDNLYRIIGVFGDQVKLIKSDHATSTQLGTDGDWYSSYIYYWNYNAGNSAVNNWTTSLLNKTNLNTNYLNNIGSTWANKIATTIWKVGGNTYANIVSQTAPNAYKNEITSPAESTTYSAKIGLMYVSDYMYGASQNYWTYKGYDTEATDYRAAKANNWMAIGVSEWTISRVSGDADRAFRVGGTGFVSSGSVNNISVVRPSFSLVSSTVLQSGSGTAANPFRIALPDNMVSFSVNSESYLCNPNTTWESFVNSEYNNGKFFMDSGNAYYNKTSTVFCKINNATTGSIITNTVYSLGMCRDFGGI